MLSSTHASITPTAATPGLLLQYAQSLIAYAQTDKQFAVVLEDTVRSYHLKTLRRNNSPASAPIPLFITLPKNREAAQNRLAWLMHEMMTAQEDVDLSTRSLLLSYVQDHSKPKAAVIGIVGIAIIGPTLGIIKRPRKRKSVLTVLVSSHVYRRTRQNMSKVVLATGSRLVSESLLTLHGDASRLEPELAEWFFADRTTKIILVDDNDLKGIVTTLTSRHLPHIVETDEMGIAAVAISPIVDLTLLNLAD